MNGPARERGGASRPQGEAPPPSVDVLAARRADERERQVKIAYPFPMTDGTLATLYLPKYLTRDDAERLKAAIDTLVVAARLDGSSDDE